MSGDRTRSTLNRARVLEAAIDLADEIGIEALTIRKLADTLGVGAMTIYHHVPSKEEIIDGMVELVYAEMEKPPADADWKRAMRQRCISARRVLKQHPWAAPLMNTRTAPGPANLSHHDCVIGCLRNGGLSIPMTAHAYAILDSFVYGFAFDEATLPAGGGEGFAEVAEQIAAHFPTHDFPNLAELTFEHVLKPGYDYGVSFEFGLDLILDGLERAAKTNDRGPDRARRQCGAPDVVGVCRARVVADSPPRASPQMKPPPTRSRAMASAGIALGGEWTRRAECHASDG